jgi:endonuclease/exonuclease/phosphatase family metal-dependent hydrolase
VAEFSTEEWRKIRLLFDSEAERFGLPQRRDESVLLASFNIRKLGGLRDSSNAPSRTREAWRFLGDVCSRFDLIGIQEIMNDLEGIRFLRDLAGADDYGIAVSDATGGVPGGQGMIERLGFMFRWKRVRRTEMASDISYDRSAVEGNLLSHVDDFAKAFTDRVKELEAIETDHAVALAAWDADGMEGRKPSKRSPRAFPMPHFLSFVRTPYCASFEVVGLGEAKPYQFLAVAAHLLYGEGTQTEQLREREAEFFALIKWLMWRMANKDVYYRDMILFGDLNLEFEKADARRPIVEQYIKEQDQALKGKSGSVYFPFIAVHPETETFAQPGTPRDNLVFRTNARADQTYDHIAFFGHDTRMPNHTHTKSARLAPDGFDFGVFNFSDLFAEALHGKPLAQLGDAERKTLYAKFEHDVSDHMPIWVRLPRPYPRQTGPLIE